MNWTFIFNGAYSTLRDRKQAFEAAISKLIKAAPGSDASSSFDEAVHAFADMYSSAQLLATELAARFPDSYSDLCQFYASDFAQLLVMFAEYTDVLVDHASKLGKTFSPPGGSDYEQFINVAALCTPDPDRDRYLLISAKHGLPRWDATTLDKKLKNLRDRIIEIPAGVDLDDPVFERVCDQLLVRQIPTALIFGSGGSIAVTSMGLPNGMPNWPQFIKYVIELAAKDGRWDSAKKQSLIDDAKRDPVRVVDRCKSALGGYWEEALEDLFSWSVVEGKVRRITLYRNLSILPFAARLTTNYDALYERINNVPAIGQQNLSKAIVKWRNGKWATYIAKIHGSIDSGDDLVVTETDYNELYNKEAWRAALRDVFLNYNVLFVGFGLSDPYFLFLMNRVVQDLKQARSPDRHYYIFTDEDDEYNRQHFEKQYGLEFVRYPRAAHIYQEYYIQRLVERYRDILNKSPLSPSR
ncbi:SIR2 family protein [Sorangium sp. So ce861]|uniref:SIR2 family protein n=1 Tax=Sorangium sp. So ce861 TaxID=3133323 RepID=UPI003F5F2859